MEPPSTNLTDWIGRTETASDVIGPTPCAAMAATLDRDPTPPERGTPLPALWHWLYFLPLHRLSAIGRDGHAQRGGFLPPVPLPRRMWAGSQCEFRKPLRVGDTIRRVSTIAAVDEKSGRSGPLVFVKVRHDISANDEAEIALTDWHDIVYRDAPTATDIAPPPQAAPADAKWEKQWVPSDVLLFRYSALTFNGHRIHYDRRYTTEVEGYPGLVVHGPLIATLLVDLLRWHQPDARVVKFAFRAVRPLFDSHHFAVCGDPHAEGKTVHLWAQDHEGWLAMDATATLA